MVLASHSTNIWTNNQEAHGFFQEGESLVDSPAERWDWLFRPNRARIRAIGREGTWHHSPWPAGLHGRLDLSRGDLKRSGRSGKVIAPRVPIVMKNRPDDAQVERPLH